MDVALYRAQQTEKERTADLLRIVPKGRSSVLDVGARDGHFSLLLADHFATVTALDLQKPAISHPRVITVAGDATALQFPDRSFDCVFCAEVLEHIPNVQAACRELIRVARHEIIIGVPFRQDTRIGRTTCRTCGKRNPPWGHVNSFDEDRLQSLFRGAKLASQSFVGVRKEATNALSAALLDFAGNPWGCYDQEEPCIHCGAKLLPPPERSIVQRVCSLAAIYLNGLQSVFVKPVGSWIHLVFTRA